MATYRIIGCSALDRCGAPRRVPTISTACPADQIFCGMDLQPAVTRSVPVEEPLLISARV
jgi:hypothetical protein